MVEWVNLAFQLMKTLESDWDYKTSRARTSYLINFILERTARQTEASGPNFLGIPLQANVGVVVGLDYKTTWTLPSRLITSESEGSASNWDQWTLAAFFFWKESKVDSRRGLQNYESAFHSIPLLQTKRGLLETEATRTRPYPSFHRSKGWKGWYKTETSQLLWSSSGGREGNPC